MSKWVVSVSADTVMCRPILQDNDFDFVVLGVYGAATRIRKHDIRYHVCGDKQAAEKMVEIIKEESGYDKLEEIRKLYEQARKQTNTKLARRTENWLGEGEFNV